jgi:hypothetical protein
MTLFRYSSAQVRKSTITGLATPLATCSTLTYATTNPLSNGHMGGKLANKATRKLRCAITDTD